MTPNPGSPEAKKLVWKQIPGYEGRYEVSDDGRVRSINWEGVSGRIKKLVKQLRKSPRNKVGYKTVRLHKNGNTHTFLVGRLVLSAFVRLPKFKEEQNHIDGNTTNDRLSNLCWVTSSENHKHAIANGLAKKPQSPYPLGCGVKYWWKSISGEYKYATPMEMYRLSDASPSPFFKMIKGCMQPYRSFHGWRLEGKPPTPGSLEAKKHFCTCAILDNNHGKGFPWGDETAFCITEGCPLHDKLEEVKE